MAAFVIKVLDDADEILPEVSVGIFDMSGSPIMSASADVDGLALFVTDEPEIRVRASLADYTFASDIVISPDDGEVYILQGSANDVEPPLDAHVCRVHGKIRDPLGGELPDRWKMKVIRVGTVGDAHSDHLITGVADVRHFRGAVSVDLIKGVSYRIGPLPVTRYGDVEFDDMNYADISVPHRATARLIDLISPKASSVTAERAASTIVGQTLTLPLAVTLTDDSETARADAYLIASSSSDHMTLQIIGSDLTVTCDEPGVYTATLSTYMDASRFSGLFYRACAPKTLHEIEVTCGP